MTRAKMSPKKRKAVADDVAAELTAHLDNGDAVALLARSFLFWSRITMRLAETADVLATRLRHRAADREVLIFYAFDDPKGRDERWYRNDFLAAAERYECLRAQLLMHVAEAGEWATAETQRLNAEKAVAP